jgi:hypothetical protein
MPKHDLTIETSLNDTDGVGTLNGEVVRVKVELPVRVCLPGESRYQLTKTIEIGTSGALLVIPGDVQTGQTLLLINPKSSNQAACKVCYVRKKEDGKNHVGVEFIKDSSQFWGFALSSMQWEAPGAALPQDAPSASKNWRAIAWPSMALVSALGLVFLLTASHPKASAAPTPAANSIAQEMANEEASLIPEINDYRLATAADFDPDPVLWLTHSGKPVGGTIRGAFSGFGESRAYVMMGNNKTWRILIMTDGTLRCDAQYKSVAIAVRVPKETIANIEWADSPPTDVDGDGLLVVRSAKDTTSGVVLFLSGDRVVSGTPVDYRLLLLNKLS